MQRNNMTCLVLLLLFSLIASETELGEFIGYVSTTVESLLPVEDELFIDNKIDQIPTYLPPAEKLVKNLARGWRILTTAQDTRRSKIKKLTPNKFGDILNSVQGHFQAVYPGTLWCGAGDLANSEEGIGFFKDTDACCRNHDFCRIAIPAGESFKELRNDGVFTRSHCDCDGEFYRCLKNVNSLIAKKIGVTYFNILRPQCFKKEYPATCIKHGHFSIARRKCKVYVADTSKNMTMQWFDNLDY